MKVSVLNTPGLGDKSYLVTHDGVGLVVDPQRDIQRFTSLLADTEIQVRYVLETHLHNDYISGGRHLASEVGADLVLPAGAGTAFEYLPAFHNEDLKAGSLVVRPLHTPGHTPEHVSYLVLVEDEPVAVFSGGSLLVGSAGRPDLLGIDRATSLVRLQYQSVRRLAALPGEVTLYPTHGAGSFCTASVAGIETSTIADEMETNPVLQYPDQEAFAASQLAGLPPHPTYYAKMGPINLHGPRPFHPTPVPEVSPAEIDRAKEQGFHVVDARHKTKYAEAHIPGSWGMELGPDFVTWIGWLFPFNTPMILILDPEDSVEEAQIALARIGFEEVRGVMWGLDPWVAENRPTATYPTMGARDYIAQMEDGLQLVDVRAPTEWADGTVPDSILCHLPDLISEPPPQIRRDQPVYLGCTTGHRASIAAGVLEQKGYQPVVLLGASILGVHMLTRQTMG